MKKTYLYEGKKISAERLDNIILWWDDMAKRYPLQSHSPLQYCSRIKKGYDQCHVLISDINIDHPEGKKVPNSMRNVEPTSTIYYVR